ncbi:MAG: helix-turn-helix transcriptional regulator [Lautropia sp.]|nr:helix-turn-helix transcriptional regulator [Lautropia sp.]
MSYYIPYDVQGDVNSESINVWLKSNAKSLGFDSCFGYVNFPLAFNSPRTRTFGNTKIEGKEGLSVDVCNAFCSPVAQTGGGGQSVCPICRCRQNGCRKSLCRFSRGLYGGYSFVVFLRGDAPVTTEERLAKQTVVKMVADALWSLAVEAEQKDARSRGILELSAREIEVLSWVADGKTGAEIGEILGISGPTVRFHLKNVLRKLGARNNASAVSRGIMLGVLSRYGN